MTYHFRTCFTDDVARLIQRLFENVARDDRELMLTNLFRARNSQPIDAVRGFGYTWHLLNVEHSDDLLRELENFSSDHMDRHEEFYRALASVVGSMDQQAVLDTAKNASPSSSLTNSAGTSTSVILTRDERPSSTGDVPNSGGTGNLTSAEAVLPNAGGTSTTDSVMSTAASLTSDGLASAITILPNSIGTFTVDGDLSTGNLANDGEASTTTVSVPSLVYDSWHGPSST
jgi:hypothetical protein